RRINRTAPVAAGERGTIAPTMSGTIDPAARGRVVPDRGPFDRRTFLDAALAVGFVSTAAAIAYPIARFLVPPSGEEPNSISVVAAKAAALRPNSGLVFPFGTKPAIVVRAPDGQLHAFTAVCTHLECTVQFDADTPQIW